MDKSKEQWIEGVLASTEGMARANAPVGLYDKVLAGLNAPKTIRGVTFPLKQWVAAAVVLVAVNVASIVYFTSQGRPVSDRSDPLSGQVQLEQTYNY